MKPTPQSSTLFPYTTLFRSGIVDEDVDGPEIARRARHALLAGGVVADVPLVDGDAGLGLELARGGIVAGIVGRHPADRKSTRLNSSHLVISYDVFCLKKKKI